MQRIIIGVLGTIALIFILIVFLALWDFAEKVHQMVPVFPKTFFLLIGLAIFIGAIAAFAIEKK